MTQKEKRNVRKCDICGRRGARIRRIARAYGKSDDFFVVQAIPVISCPHCGESYMEAETLHELERIKIHRKSFVKKRQVPVAIFA